MQLILVQVCVCVCVDELVKDIINRKQTRQI